MLTKIRIALIPCLLTTLWSSCGSAMKLDVDSEDDLDLPPVQPLPLSVLGLAPSKNTQVKLPKHYRYLLIKYGYSDKYMNDLNYYGEYKVKDYAIKSILGYEITPTVGSEIQRWQTNWNARRETYKNARKEYNRAIKTDDTDRKKKATADFQPILRQVLRKHGSLEAICMVQKIEEEIQKQQMNQIKREFNKSQEYRDYVQAKANLATNDAYPDFIQNLSTAKEQLLHGELAKELKQLGFYNAPEEFSEIFNEIDNNPNVEPLNQELIETDLYETFQSEFRNIRKFMYYSESSKKIDDTLEPFDLDLQEIKPAIAHLRRLISYFKKNNEIQSEVNLSYNSDYLPETSSTWSQKQWENWWNGNKIEEVKRDIKVSVEADHPHHSFRVRFLGRDPSEKDLQSIGEKELVLYLTNNLLVCKIKDKNHKEINHVEKTGTTGLKLSTYKSLVEALSKEETGEINSETSWKVLNYALICGYLPDTFSVEEMSRMRKDRKEVLDILLLKKGWEIDDGIWQKKGRPAVKPELPESALTEEDRKFLKYWKPFSIDNNLFTKIETHLNPILKEKPIVTLEEIGEDSKTVWKNYPAPIQLDALRLDQYKLSDQTYPQESIAYADLKPHRQGMLECMKAVKNEKAIKRIKEKFMEYSEEDLKTYNKLYDDLKEILIKSRELEFIMDKPYSHLINSPGFLNYYLPTVSYIPTRRTFFASNVPYTEQPPIQEIDLSSNSLNYNHFTELVLADTELVRDATPLVTQEKKRQGKPLLAGYKEINLSYNNLKGLERLFFSDDLEMLFLSHTGLTSLRVLNLPKNALPKLIILDLSYNDLDIIQYLSNFTSLLHLDLAYNALVTIQPICDNLTLLKILNLSGNTQLFQNQQETFRCLEDLHVLQELYLADCKLGGKLVAFFSDPMEKLRVLDVRNNPNVIFPDNKEEIKIKLPKLEILHTDDTTITWQ